MVAGLYDSVKLELDFGDGNGWVDLTASLNLGRGVTVKRGRPTETEDISPAELTATLNNPVGDLTPDNPSSIYWPYVIEGVQARFSVTKSGASLTGNRRFVGVVTGWAPEFPDGVPARATVTISATDILGRVNDRQVLSDVVEQLVAATTGAETCDIWPLDDGVGLRNAGVGDPQRGQAVPDGGTAGTVGFSGPPDSGVHIDGVATFDAAMNTQTDGWVLELPVQPGSKSVLLILQVRGDLPATATAHSLAGLWQANGVRSIDIRREDAGQLEIFDSGGILSISTREIPADSWFLVLGTEDPVDPDESTWTVFWADGTSDAVSNRPVPLHATSHIVVGANMSPAVPRRNTRAGPMTCGGVLATTLAWPGLETYVVPGATMAEARAEEYVDYLANYGQVTALTVLGSTDVEVGRSATTGRTIGDLLAELARTIGGSVYADRAGDLALELPDHARPTALTATVTLEQDDIADTARWVRSVTDVPTRVTASSPYTGEITVTNAAAEAAGVPRGETVQTCALTTTQAEGVASWYLNRSRALALRSLSVDLVTSANVGLWTGMCALEPGHRIRVAALPSTQLGRTYSDVYVQGWTETWTERAAVFDLDTTPADQVEARFDTGRFAPEDGAMTVTSGTAVGTTSNGTIVVTTAAGPTLTTAAGDYPMDLDWNGETVTVTSAPAGSTSPQTLTTTARGVAASLARVHSAGEVIEPVPAVFAI